MAFMKPDEILRKKLALAVKSIQWSYAIIWSTNPTKGCLGKLGEMAFKQPDEILRKKVALAVKSIQWSYVIFWSTNPTKGVLEWSNGYYNGDIKTRKTVQASEELDTDELGFHRTEQLRELYESLLDVETNTQSTRPAAALYPEDLTDTEWYFMVCMSYEFNIGQGLPGRTLEKNETIWLSNACYADSKIFSRALLARSASIQTVVCFPYAEVVLELGTTELVWEDFNIIQQMTTSLMGIPPTTVTTNSNYIYQEMSTCEKDNSTVYVDQVFLDDSNINIPMEMNEFNLYSTFDNNNNNINMSQGLEPNCEVYKAQMLEGIDFQEQSWPFIDDGISNIALNFETSSDCISQTFPSPENLVLIPDEDMRNNDQQPGFQISNAGENQQTINEVLPRDGTKYVGIVSTILKSSHQLILGPCFQRNLRGSSFVRWKSGGFLPSTKSRNRGAASQRLLKKVVYEVAKMHSGCMLNNGSAEKKRREKIHEKLGTLGSMVPSTGKIDKVSLHDDTIQYLKNLENMVDDLESQDVVSDFDHEPRRKKPWCVMERTSDRYSSNGIRKNYKMEVLNKIKGSDVNEKEGIYQVQRGNDFTDDVVVSKIEKNVVIEIKCTWRDGLLLEIMDAISNFGLDSYSVQSSIAGEKFLLTAKSKVKGPTTASIHLIKQVLQGLARKC